MFKSCLLANVSIIRSRNAGSMALKLLENGLKFNVRTNLKGFKEYVTKRGLVQNKGVYLDMSNDNHLEEIFCLGDHTLLSVKTTSNEPLSSRSFVNYWIAAPQASTDIGSWLAGTVTTLFKAQMLQRMKFVVLVVMITCMDPPTILII